MVYFFTGLQRLIWHCLLLNFHTWFGMFFLNVVQVKFTLIYKHSLIQNAIMVNYINYLSFSLSFPPFSLSSFFCLSSFHPSLSPSLFLSASLCLPFTLSLTLPYSFCVKSISSSSVVPHHASYIIVSLVRHTNSAVFLRAISGPYSISSRHVPSLQFQKINLQS